MSILKRSDDLGAQLFSSYFPQGSVTVIGATESWTTEELSKNGWISTCRNQSMPGVAYCLSNARHHGYVVTGDATYDPRNPEVMGAHSLLMSTFTWYKQTFLKLPLELGQKAATLIPQMPSQHGFLKERQSLSAIQWQLYPKALATGMGEQECSRMLHLKNQSIKMQLQTMKSEPAVATTRRLILTTLAKLPPNTSLPQ